MTDKNPEKIRKMFDEIAARYDFINGIISFGTHKRGKKQAIRDLPPLPGNAEILDLCTGTGDLAYFLKSRGRVTGLDFSQNMLAAARKKVPEADFILGDCTKLPFKDNSFDLVTIGFGLRNIENPDRAIEEIVRVLKPDGIFMHLDFGKSSNFADKIFDFIVPPLVKIFYKNSIPYDYLLESKKTFKSPDELIKTFENYGFKFERRHDFLFGVISSQIMKK